MYQASCGLGGTPITEVAGRVNVRDLDREQSQPTQSQLLHAMLVYSVQKTAPVAAGASSPRTRSRLAVNLCVAELLGGINGEGAVLSGRPRLRRRQPEQLNGLSREFKPSAVNGQYGANR